MQGVINLLVLVIISLSFYIVYLYRRLNALGIKPRTECAGDPSTECAGDPSAEDVCDDICTCGSGDICTCGKGHGDRCTCEQCRPNPSTECTSNASCGSSLSVAGDICECGCDGNCVDTCTCEAEEVTGIDKTHAHAMILRHEMKQDT